METNLLDRMLANYLELQSPVTVTLQNKIRVSGRIRAFDSYIVIIEGQKREIIYRHAMSSLASVEEHKKVSLPAPDPAKPMLRNQKTGGDKPKKARQQPSLAASSNETSINNTMKEGLLRWMQEQKAAK
jgi:RNA chaperone Hfq